MHYTQGYYLPNVNRKNLLVLDCAVASKIITKADSDNSLVATGVEFVHSGKTYVAHAKKEVIVSAG